MQQIQTYKDFFETSLSKLEFNRKPVELYDPISYTLSLGGKRMRPILLLLTCEMLGTQKEDAIHQAMAIEVFHNFTLLHDDIMDQAPLRRNKPTVYKKWNENIAILSGDVMFVESCKLMLKNAGLQAEKILNTFFDAAIEVCEGQQWDMNFEQIDQVSIDEYLWMIELKTAALLGAALQIGAYKADSNEEDALALKDFGRNIGVAFQLKDDILDCYGDPELVGKQPGGDILANKKTFLFIKAKEKAQGYDQESLTSLINTKEFNANEKVKSVLSIYEKYEVKKEAENAMIHFYEKAIISLNKINVHNEQKKLLRAFAGTLMERTF